MRCSKCGADLASGVAFCRECGTKVEYRQVKFCRECGSKLIVGARFCLSCGAKVNFKEDVGTISGENDLNKKAFKLNLDEIIEEDKSNELQKNKRDSIGERLDHLKEIVGDKDLFQEKITKKVTEYKDTIQDGIIGTKVNEYKESMFESAPKEIKDLNAAIGNFTNNQPKKKVSRKTIGIIFGLVVLILLFSLINGRSKKEDDVVTNINSTEESVEKNTRKEKSGFDESTNFSTEIGNYCFSIPEYWDPDIQEEDNFRAYAETSGKVAMLQIMLSEDENDPVTFDILKEETEDGKMADAFKSWYDSCGEVKSSLYEYGDSKGYLYSCDYTQDGYDGVMKCLVLPSVEDNSWLFVTLMETNNTDYTYYEDFDKIINSINKKKIDNEDTEVSETESEEETKTSQDTETDGEKKTESSEEKANSDNLTVDNCPELAAMLSNKADIDPSYASFAEKYQGQNIEFDGRIDYCTKYENYNTRFDYLVSAGDYDPDHQTGPSFKFENVNYSDLHTNLDTVSVGLNVHIVAKVISFDSDTGLFYLEPVSITGR